MRSPALGALAAFLLSAVTHAQYTATWDPYDLPPTTEADQYGTNQCGTDNNQTSLCQNAFLNNVQDFCIWGPPEPNSVIGHVEQIVVSYCTKPGRGTRLIPEGTLRSAHFVETPDYIQITGFGDFTSINIADGDAGGELDPHGPDGLGNPHGGLLFSNVWTGDSNSLGQQIHEWTNFQSSTIYCIRACKPGPRAPVWCEHIYDIMGCMWNMPGNYEDGFTSCKGDSGIPMGLYPQPDGTTSSFHQSQPVTPPAHPAPSVSQCETYRSTALYASTAFETPTATPTASVSSPGAASSSPAETSSPNSATSMTNPTLSFTLITMLSGLFAGAIIIF